MQTLGLRKKPFTLFCHRSFEFMVTVEAAQRLINKETLQLETEEVKIANALGRILGEDLYADLDFPSYDSIRMDGIAINFAAFESGRRTFKIEKLNAAGMPQATLENSENCIEIMTGAVCPINADTNIRYEDLKIENGNATIQIENITKGQNIHRKGKNRKQGDLIIPKGRRITAAEIGVAATIGKPSLKVIKPPKIAVVSSGDELVEVAQNPKPHQKRRSNPFACQAQLAAMNISSDLFHLIDDEASIHENLAKILDEYDVVILSGGVSMGKFDLIPKGLERLGVEKSFYKVYQRPGKPFWFGTHKAKNVKVFAFPGNPVSIFVGMEAYLLPWLRRQMGMNIKTYPKVVLAEEVNFKPDLLHYMQVHLETDDQGRTLAFPRKGKGSGDHANLADVSGFIILPRGKDVFEVGECFELIRFR